MLFMLLSFPQSNGFFIDLQQIRYYVVPSCLMLHLFFQVDLTTSLYMNFVDALGPGGIPLEYIDTFDFNLGITHRNNSIICRNFRNMTYY